MPNFLVFYVKNHDKAAAPLRFDEVYTEQGCEFDLYAVVQHIGESRREGHYVSYIKSFTGIWHKFDDETVTAINFEKVSKLKIYIWVYFKRLAEPISVGEAGQKGQKADTDVIGLMLE